MRKEHTWCWPVEPEERWDIDTPWLAARPWKPHRFIPPWKPFPILWKNEQHKCWNRVIVHTYWLTHPHIGRGQNVLQTVSFLCTWNSEDRFVWLMTYRQAREHLVSQEILWQSSLEILQLFWNDLASGVLLFALVYPRRQLVQHGIPNGRAAQYEYWLSPDNSQSTDIRWLRTRKKNKGNQHTWSTVTGTLTPWSFQRDAMPRFRAIRPVRTELGVHFVEVGTSGLEASLLGLEAAADIVEWICLAQSWRWYGRWTQSLSILIVTENAVLSKKGKCLFQCKPGHPIIVHQIPQQRRKRNPGNSTKATPQLLIMGSSVLQPWYKTAVDLSGDRWSHRDQAVNLLHIHGSDNWPSEAHRFQAINILDVFPATKSPLPSEPTVTTHQRAGQGVRPSWSCP